MNKIKASTLWFSILYWMLSGFYFVILRYFGLGPYAPPDLNLVEVASYAGIVGFAIGLLFGFFPLNNLLHFRSRRSFLKVVLVGTICYVLFFIVVIFLASSFGNSLAFALHYVLSPEGLITLLHLTMASAMYQFILQVNKKFGPGLLLEYATGRYFTPKEEDRAFMFLDLRSSTYLAETLEHVSYSRLMQDCYAELTIPLMQYHAQVYQYVGDEVVVSWKMNKSFNASCCHEFFYAFQEKLEAKRSYFLDRYSVYPEFKAGVHCGKVTVAEVGEIKTEIAYHGDVLNVASRIQSLCNKFDQSLLVSEALVNRLPEKDKGKVKFVDEVELRGKGMKTKVFGIVE